MAFIGGLKGFRIDLGGFRGVEMVFIGFRWG